MLVNVRGKGNHVRVTDAIQTSVNKAARKLEKYVSENAELTAVISVDGIQHTAELTLKDKGTFTRVEENGADMYQVIHDAGEMLERKVRQYKEKLTAKRAGRPTTRAVAPRVGEVLAGSDAGDDPEPNTEIRRVKKFGIKPMFPEDAVLEMELVGHDFFVFMNAEEQCKVNVIYKRKNGGYGLIQPTYE